MKSLLLDFAVRQLLFQVAVLANEGIYVPRVNSKKIKIFLKNQGVCFSHV